MMKKNVGKLDQANGMDYIESENDSRPKDEKKKPLF